VAGALVLSAVAAQAPREGANVFPPWQHGRNNDSIDRGFEFTIPQVDVLADFHGDPLNAKLVLYVGGNYFFAMAPLVEAFEARHPELRGRIYWETIPPGLLVKQMDVRIDNGKIDHAERLLHRNLISARFSLCPSV